MQLGVFKEDYLYSVLCSLFCFGTCHVNIFTLGENSKAQKNSLNPSS